VGAPALLDPATRDMEAEQRLRQLLRRLVPNLPHKCKTVTAIYATFKTVMSRFGTCKTVNVRYGAHVR